MAIDSVTIGPFKGGLNNISQAGEAADTELVELVNMSFTTDGALTSRPPMHNAGNLSNTQAPYDVLGVYRESPTIWWLLIQVKVANGWEIRAFKNANFSEAPAVVRTTTGNANKVSAFVQVNDFGYFCAAPISGSTLSGFKWKPGSTYSDITAMPKGYNMVSFKSRLWITGSEASANNSRMWFSTIDQAGIKIETWNTSVDFFDVAPGEGGYITALIALNSSLIVFKNDGSWRYSYATSPAKGQVDKISGTVGAANRNVVVEFNNLVYTYDQGKLYELVNNNYSAINRKIEFREDNQAVHQAVGTDLSVVGTNLVLRYFNAVYVFSAETGTWSQWRTSAGIPGKFVELPTDSNSSRPSVFIAPTQGNFTKENEVVPYKIIALEGDYSSVTPVEDIQCVIRTKAYDYKAPSVIKRLFWWGIDHKSFTTFEASVIPVVSRRKPTWGELRQHTWEEMRQGTWGNPFKWKALVTAVSDTFDVSSEQTDNGRIFSKIRKSLRFRQVSYEIKMNTKGSADTGPVKIFTLITHVTSKHHVVDKNN